MHFDGREDPGEYDPFLDQDAQGTLTDDEMSEQDTDGNSPQALGRTIERGVQFLTEHFPGWYTRIDLHYLDISDANACVLAQAAGTDFDGAYETALGMTWGSGRTEHADRHGFVSGSPFYERELEIGWQVAIRILRLTR